MITPCFFGTRSDGMYAATYEITNTCNLSCKHCMNQSSKESFSGLSIQDSLALINEMYDVGVRSLYISGGEPLTYLHIDQVLRFCKEKGFKLSMATNGVLAQQHIDTIVECVQDISVSLDGVGTVHDDFRSMPGMFDIVEKTFATLRGKVNIIVSTVIWKGNKNSLEDIVDFVYKAGASQINFSYLVPIGRAVSSNIHIAKEDYHLIKEKIIQLQEKYADKDFLILFRRSNRITENSLECAGGSMIMHVTASGKIAPCSWCAKLSEEYDNLLTCQWARGNMPQCVARIRNLQEINRQRKEKFGYTGCPAMSLVYSGSFDADDPLNVLL